MMDHIVHKSSETRIIVLYPFTHIRQKQLSTVHIARRKYYVCDSPSNRVIVIFNLRAPDTLI
jgi:hypothetical protein